MRPEDYERVRRRVRIFCIVTAALYVLAGFLLSYQAYAQERVTYKVIGRPIVEPVPTGSDDASAEAYYNYLYLRHLQQLSESYYFNPKILGWMYGFLGITLIIFYAFAFSWYARRRREDLYPVEVYNGYITERGGPVDALNWALYTILIAYAAYYTIVNLIWGQNY